jgi:hypothetical protein
MCCAKRSACMTLICKPAGSCVAASHLRLRTAHPQAGEGIVGGTPHPPLVGNIAPDFSAQAVYDQEFIDITLSQYRG